VINQKEEHHFLWFGVSISIHLLILACIFVSLKNKPSLVRKPHEKKISFKVPAPIVFYGQQMAPNKKPGSLAQPAQQATQPQKQAQPSQKQAQPSQQETQPQKQTQPPSKLLPTKKTPESIPVKKQPTAVTSTKKDLSLADIFNHARQNFNIPKKTDLQAPGDGAGQPLVIREGDMKYYSLWSTFLHHLNNAARFNQVKSPLPLGEWLQNRFIKNNLQFAITINKKGEVQDISIMVSSGYKPYDERCIQDTWSASPFPPLPDQLGKNVARFEVRTNI
jgi:outer membrane biosynthesis protein TonB